MNEVMFYVINVDEKNSRLILKRLTQVNINDSQTFRYQYCQETGKYVSHHLK